MSGSPLDLSDTIVAIATPPGRGALAVVRLSGRDAHAIARAAVERWPITPRAAVVTYVRGEHGELLDHSVVIRYDAPASYTGEDSVEIITHGGVVVPTTVVAALLARGARLAAPGEFTRRAVLNGKLDILQAEATADLVDSGSRAAQSLALRQLDGGLSRRILSLREQLISLEALIAYDIDFPEEDDGPIPRARIAAAADDVITALEQLLRTAHVGELVREGALVVLAGRPNVGKSSLFNALLGQARAIVTDIPGTTRDAIEAVIDTPQVPLRLVDTAGLRESTDAVERIGVEVSTTYVARAAVVLACADSDQSMVEIGAALSATKAGSVIAVRTKSDLNPPTPRALEAARAATAAHTAVAVSAETGEGLGELLDAVTRTISSGDDVAGIDAPVLAHERHRFAVARAVEEARLFRDDWASGRVPVTVAAVHLREAVATLEDLVGAVDVEDVLDEVFRRFCVGK